MAETTLNRLRRAGDRLVSQAAMQGYLARDRERGAESIRRDSLEPLKHAPTDRVAR